GQPQLQGELARGLAAGTEAVLQPRMLVVDGAQAPHLARQLVGLRAQRSRGLSIEVARDAAGQYDGHEHAMSERAGVRAQHGLFEARDVRQSEGKAAVVAEIAQVAEMIGDALALEAERAEDDRARWHGELRDRFGGLRIGPGVRHRAIARDPAGEPIPVPDRQLLEALLDALVHVAQTFLEAQHLLADDLEAEVSRFDDPRVDGSDRDLVHAVAADAHEGIVLLARLPLRGSLEIAPKRKGVDRPRGLPQPGPLVVGVALQADQVERGALHAVRRWKDRR